MQELNVLSDSDFDTSVMVSKRSKEDLEKLFSHLFEKDWSAISANTKKVYLQSLIIRSEVELFGLSYPRFAAGILLGNNRFCFRRLGEFANQQNIRFFPRWQEKEGGKWDKPINFDEPLPEDFPEPAEIIKNASPIAECWIETPHEYNGSDWILTDNGDHHYFKANKTKGSVFVKNIPLPGGGLCAQHSIFMASFTMYQFVDTVHSLPEITFHATEDLKPDETFVLPISGLGSYDIVRYFSKNRLNSFNETCTNKDDSFEAKRKLRDSIHSYIASGFPVILCINCTALGNQAFSKYYERNGFKVVYDSTKPRGHAIVVVGSKVVPSKDFEDVELLVHDSSYHPYMRATISEVYYSQVDLHPERMENIGYISIVPQEVVVPLTSAINEDGSTVLGVSNIVDTFLSVTRKKPTVILSREYRRHFRLCRFLGSEVKLSFDSFEVVISRGKNLSANRWYWVFIDTSSEERNNVVRYYVFDAESPLEECSNEKPFNIQHAGQTETVEVDGQAKPRFSKASLSSPHTGNLVESKKKSSFPIISSVSVQSLNQSVEIIKKFSSKINLYAFMINDLRSFSPRSLSVTEHLGKRKDHVEYARKINNSLNGLQLTAISTFIPEITHSKSAIASAVESLLFLLKVATILKCTHRQPIDHLEIVAGSRFKGVAPPDPDKSSDEYSVNVISKEHGFKLLKIALNRLAKKIDLEEDIDSEIKVSLEMEPGIFKLFGKPQDAFVIFEQCCIHRETIGFNLDIGHWSGICGVSVSDIKTGSFKRIKDRFFSAHISDHEKAHFGDMPIGSVVGKDIIRKWLSFCENENIPVSVELECLEELTHLQTSIDLLNELQ